MKIVKDTKFCVTNWSALDRKQWPSVVACAKQTGPIVWAWPKRVTPLSLKWLIKSSETYELPGRSVTVDQNSFLVINEGTEYGSRIESTSDVETASIFLNADICSRVLSSFHASAGKLLDEPEGDELRSLSFVERLYPRDEALTKTLTCIHQLANASGTEIELEEQMYRLTERLVELNEATRTEIEKLDFVKAGTREEIYKRVHVCRDFILSNLERDLSLDALAIASAMSPHHLLRMFKDVFRETPHQFITKARLERARILVRGTTKPIGEIAFEVGFESIPSFSTLYKKNFSCSPARDRQDL